jgi:hypothetical protein
MAPLSDAGLVAAGTQYVAVIGCVNEGLAKLANLIKMRSSVVLDFIEEISSPKKES